MSDRFHSGLLMFYFWWECWSCRLVFGPTKLFGPRTNFGTLQPNCLTSKKDLSKCLQALKGKVDWVLNFSSDTQGTLLFPLFKEVTDLFFTKTIWILFIIGGLIFGGNLVHQPFQIKILAYLPNTKFEQTAAYLHHYIWRGFCTKILSWFTCQRQQSGWHGPKTIQGWSWGL